LWWNEEVAEAVWENKKKYGNGKTKAWKEYHKLLLLQEYKKSRHNTQER